MIPRENLERLTKYADEIGVPARHLIEEYEKISRSNHLEKYDDVTRHVKAMKEVKTRIVDLAKIKKYRKGIT